MDAGALDRRIALQRATMTRDAFNEPVYAWSTLATVWASKTDVSDRERLTSAEVAAEISTRFRVRWSSVTASLTPKDRVSYDGKNYDIVSVKEISRRAGVEISAVARADQ